MGLTIRYVGSGETGLTVNNIYPVLAVVDGSCFALIIDDGGDIYRTADIRNTAEWEVVEATSVRSAL